jgi:hypothetical protein
MEHWHKERIKKKMIMRALYNNSKEARAKTKKLIRNSLNHFRFMPIKIPYPYATLIYSNKVVIQSWTDDPFSVVIENEKMAHNQRLYFKELWKIAKE